MQARVIALVEHPSADGLEDDEEGAPPRRRGRVEQEETLL